MISLQGRICSFLFQKFFAFGSPDTRHVNVIVCPISAASFEYVVSSIGRLCTISSIVLEPFCIKLFCKRLYTIHVYKPESFLSTWSIRKSDN